MSLSAGSVTIDGSAVATGSRLALALFNAKKSAYDAAVATFVAGGGGAAPTTAEKKRVFDLFALEANAMATAIIGEFTTNANPRITITNHDIDVSGSPATGPSVDMIFAGELL